MRSLRGVVHKGMLVSLLLRVMYSKQSIANSTCKYKPAHVCIFATHVERNLYNERTRIEQRSGAPETPDRRGVRGGGTRYARLRCHRQTRVYHGADGEDWGLPRAVEDAGGGSDGDLHPG